MANYGAIPYQGGFGANPDASSNWYKEDATDERGNLVSQSSPAPAPTPIPAAIQQPGKTVLPARRITSQPYVNPVSGYDTGVAANYTPRGGEGDMVVPTQYPAPPRLAYATREDRINAIPGQMTEGEQMLSGSEQRVRAIAASRPAYTPQYGTQGAISQTPAYQMEQADARQQALTGPFKPNQQTSANVTKQYGPQGELLGYTGKGTGRPSLDQQERDKEMSSRGMVRDPYGNWMPPGGWGGGEQPRQAVGRTGYFDNPAMNAPGGGEAPQINYGGDWNDYLKSIAPAVSGSKSRRIAQEQSGAERLGAQRTEGALGLVEREGALRRQAAGEERTFKQPEQESQIAAQNAQTRLYGAHAGTYEAQADWNRKLNVLRQRASDPNATPQDRDAAGKALTSFGAGDKTDTMAIKAKTYAELVNSGMKEPEARQLAGFAGGGFIEGYADGGAIGRAQTQQLNPLVSQYGQYLQAAAQTGVAPVPFTQYINLLGSTRGAMQQTPSQFADGGDVSTLNRPLEGPGTGRSDSIPAVIDGVKPAALSRGEFVLDEETTKYYGTKFLKELQRKAKEALTGGVEGDTANG